jgi:hypothetical protein
VQAYYCQMKRRACQRGLHPVFSQPARSLIDVLYLYPAASWPCLLCGRLQKVYGPPGIAKFLRRHGSPVAQHSFVHRLYKGLPRPVFQYRKHFVFGICAKVNLWSRPYLGLYPRIELCRAVCDVDDADHPALFSQPLLLRQQPVDKVRGAPTRVGKERVKLVKHEYERGL